MPENAGDKATSPWNIIFMGTPDFAVPTLSALIDGPDRVVAAVAQPDRPANRGQKLSTPPTVTLARQRGIPTLQPSKVRGPAFVAALSQFDPDLIVVVAYGRILTETVLQVPRYGCVNVHGSLLPRYRGASPVQWALLRGETVTGITTMKMDPGMDTGDILLKREYPIPPRANAGHLHEALASVGAELLIETVSALKAGVLTPIPQDHTAATLAPLLKKEDGLIDWSRPAEDIDWHVRGMSPWPGAYSFLNDLRMVILEGTPMPQTSTKPPGSVVSASSDGVIVSTGNGDYRIERLKPENSKAMNADAYLCGHSLSLECRFISHRVSP